MLFEVAHQVWMG